MSTPKIPKGWRRLRKRSQIKNGDKRWSIVHNKWIQTEMAGCFVGEGGTATYYIRRIARKGGKGAK